MELDCIVIIDPTQNGDTVLTFGKVYGIRIKF
jgi:hypothetical protein